MRPCPSVGRLVGNSFVKIDEKWPFTDSKWFRQCWTRRKERQGGRSNEENWAARRERSSLKQAFSTRLPIKWNCKTKHKWKRRMRSCLRTHQLTTSVLFWYFLLVSFHFHCQLGQIRGFLPVEPLAYLSFQTWFQILYWLQMNHPITR